MVPAVSEPMFPVLLKRFVVDAVVAKKLVEVAEVKTALVLNTFVEVLFEVVLFTPVKFCKVEEPVAT